MYCWTAADITGAHISPVSSLANSSAMASSMVLNHQPRCSVGACPEQKRVSSTWGFGTSDIPYIASVPGSRHHRQFTRCDSDIGSPVLLLLALLCEFCM